MGGQRESGGSNGLRTGAGRHAGAPCLRAAGMAEPWHRSDIANSSPGPGKNPAGTGRHLDGQYPGDQVLRTVRFYITDGQSPAAQDLLGHFAEADRDLGGAGTHSTGE